jgi:hypothetical protein
MASSESSTLSPPARITALTDADREFILAWHLLNEASQICKPCKASIIVAFCESLKQDGREVQLTAQHLAHLELLPFETQ